MPAILILLIANFLFCILLKVLIDRIFLKTTADNFHFTFTDPGFIQILFRSVYYALYATFYWLFVYASAIKTKSLESEKSKLLAENQLKDIEIQFNRAKNAYLQQQFNPHMLFNTLNFIYNDLQKFSAESADCALKLSEILRYGLDNSNIEALSPLSAEIEQVRNLVSIHRSRYRGNLHLHLALTDDTRHFQIIPLALVTLTENIFKHGLLNSEAKPASITLLTDMNVMVFKTFNFKKPLTASLRKTQLGIGNLRTRLNYHYGDNYTMEISDTEEDYQVILRISQ